jgi:hypothetical protein
MSTTDEMLDLLATLGAPHLHRHDDGKWSASIKFPAPAGVTAEVRSDFNHPTHRSALTQLLARIGEIKGIGDGITAALAKVPPPPPQDETYARNGGTNGKGRWLR